MRVPRRGLTPSWWWFKERATTHAVPRGVPRPMRAVALLLALALAGCLSPEDASPRGPSESAPDVLPWGLASCRYVVAFVPADAAKLQARMPDGFEVATRPAGPLGLAPGAQLGVEAFECARGQGLGGEVEGLTYGSLFAAATPPEAWRDEDLAFTFVKWDTLVPDAERRALLVDRGLPARGGDVAWPAAPAGTLLAQLRLDGVGAFQFTLAATQSSPAPGEGGDVFAEFTPLDGGGLAVWRARFAWDEGTDLQTGRGTVELPAGSWAADVVGATRAAATFHAGTWTFYDGTLTLPARPS